MPATLDLPLRLGQPMMHQQPALRTVVVELTQNVLDLPARNAQPQVLPGHGLERMGFVKNHGVVIGQQARAHLPQGQIAKEERVIHQQHLRVLRSATRGEIETIAVCGTLATQTVAPVAGDFIPHTRERLKVQIGQRAVACLPRPLVDAP